MGSWLENAFQTCWSALTPSRRSRLSCVCAELPDEEITARTLAFDDAWEREANLVPESLPRLSGPEDAGQRSLTARALAVPQALPEQPPSPPPTQLDAESSSLAPRPEVEAAAVTRIGAAYKRHLKRRALDTSPVAPAEVSRAQLVKEMVWISRCLLSSARDMDWSLRVVAIRRLQALALGGPEDTSELESRLAPIVPGLIQQACDLRSSVVKDACNAIAALAQRLGTKFEPHAETILPALFKLLFVTIKAISEAGNTCIRSILQSSSISKGALSSITEGATAHKHGATRQRCAEYILLLLENAAARERLSADHESRDRLASSIQRCVADALPGVRETGRRCFVAFRGVYGASQADSLLSRLDAATQRQLRKQSPTRPAAGATRSGTAAPAPAGRGSDTRSMIAAARKASLAKAGGRGGPAAAAAEVEVIESKKKAPRAPRSSSSASATAAAPAPVASAPAPTPSPAASTSSSAPRPATRTGPAARAPSPAAPTSTTAGAPLSARENGTSRRSQGKSPPRPELPPMPAAKAEASVSSPRAAPARSSSRTRAAGSSPPS